MPGIGYTDFPTYYMLPTASMMRHPGVNEAFETEIPEEESEEEEEVNFSENSSIVEYENWDI